ncbi:hypothetical protein PG987_006523 [Apiospora arundinis]
MSATEPALIPPDADLHSIPVGLPPPGYESNFIDPPSQVWIPQLAIYTTLPVAIFLILLRIYARLRLKNGLFCEDYLCILGGGDCVITSLYCVAGVLVKNSLLFLFRRMFSPSPLAKTVIDLGIILTTISYTVLFAVWIYYAVPHVGETGWFDPVLAVRVAKNSPRIMVALGFVSTFTDFYLIAIPLGTISGLNMSWGKKIGVSAVFVTGLLYVIPSLPYARIVVASARADSPHAKGLRSIYRSISLSVPKLSVHVHNSVSRWLLDIYAVLRFSAPNSSQNGNFQSSAIAAREIDAEESSYTEIESVDMEYHNYLTNAHH